MREIKKILVIRFRRVGDALLSSVLCNSLKETFPDAQVDYVLNEAIAPLFYNNPNINKFITFSNEENKDFKTYRRKVKQVMREGKYDVIIDTRSTIKTLWFSWFSLRTPFRIGTYKAYSLFAHNYRIRNHWKGGGDAVERNLRLLKPLEKIAKVVYDPKFRIYVTDEEKTSFRSYMEKQGINFSKPVVVCSVVTRVPEKAWGEERMQTVLQHMLAKYPDVQAVFNFAPDERDWAFRLYEAMGKPANVFMNIEAKGLRQLSAMLSQANFFFGNEGGPRHMAQALFVPSFAIFSPGAVKSEWLPNAADSNQGIAATDMASEEELEKMTREEQFNTITVDEVWNRLDSMLSRYLPAT